MCEGRRDEGGDSHSPNWADDTLSAMEGYLSVSVSQRVVCESALLESPRRLAKNLDSLAVH